MLALIADFVIKSAIVLIIIFYPLNAIMIVSNKLFGRKNKR